MTTPFWPGFVSWKPGEEVHKVQRIDALENNEDVDINSSKAQPLIHEFLLASSLHEEIDRLPGVEVNELVRKIVATAALSIVMEKEA